MFKKVLCALLCAVLLLSLCACNSVDIATYEGMTLDSSMYALHLAIEKRAIQEYLYYYYQMDISSTPAFWDEYYDQDNKITWTDYVQTEFCNMLVAMKFCKEHGISMSDENNGFVRLGLFSVQDCNHCLSVPRVILHRQEIELFRILFIIVHL